MTLRERRTFIVSFTASRLGWLAPEARCKPLQGIPKIHLGVDFKAAYGEAVHAMADGQVVCRRTDVTNFGGDGGVPG